MKINYKLLFLTTLTLFVSLFSAILNGILKEGTVALPQETNEVHLGTIDLSNELKEIARDSIINKFPAQAYLNSTNYYSVSKIKNDLTYLDSLLKDKYMVREELLGELLTKKLFEKKYPLGLETNLDSINVDLQWIEKFNAYSEVDPMPENKIFYKAIYGYWMKELSLKLIEYGKGNNDAKYNFHYRFLSEKFNEKRFNVGDGKDSTIEKVIKYSLESNWAHLFKSSWDQASIIQIIILSSILIITLFCYATTIIYFTKSK